MTNWLRKATSVNAMIGPFVDESNAKSAETGLTPSVALSKNGAAGATRNAGGTVTHDDEGWYACPLNSVDTDTTGRLLLRVHNTAALPVWHEFMVIASSSYDAMVTNGLADPATQSELNSAKLELED